MPNEIQGHIVGIEDGGALFSMVVGWMMFGVIFPFMNFSAPSIEMVFLLEYPVLEPIETHIHCSGLTLFDHVSDDVACCCVVCLD